MDYYDKEALKFMAAAIAFIFMVTVGAVGCYEAVRLPPERIMERCVNTCKAGGMKVFKVDVTTDNCECAP